MRYWPAAVLVAALIPAAGCDTSSSDGKPAGRAARKMKAEYTEREWTRPPLDSPEWKKQPSGLEIWDAKEGTGDPVPAGATVTIHYVGWLTDAQATEFDSSVKRGQPATFPLGGLIKGWQEGIPGMKPGGVRRLKIPPELAYGSQQKGSIPPNSTLVFEIELLDFQ